jgi:hypothetical protein
MDMKLRTQVLPGCTPPLATLCEIPEDLRSFSLLGASAFILYTYISTGRKWFIDVMTFTKCTRHERSQHPTGDLHLSENHTAMG